MQPLKLTISEKEYFVPTSWELVTFEKYINFDIAESDEEKLKVLSGIEQLFDLEESIQSIIIQALDFCHSEPVLNEPIEVDILQCEYGKYAVAMDEIAFYSDNQNPKLINRVLPKLVAIYTRTYWMGFKYREVERISDLIAHEYFGKHLLTGYQLLSSLINESNKLSGNLKNIPLKQEEKMAGADTLGKELGHALKIYHMSRAENDVKNYKELEKMRTEDVFGLEIIKNRLARYSYDLDQAYKITSKTKRA